MDIRGFIDTSFVDWDKKVSCVVFTAGCNLRCNFCYNFGLVLHPQKFEKVPEDHILEYLREHSDFIDGVCITGGEPTLQGGLTAFCREVKTLGIGVKLDTNGTNSEIVEALHAEGLIDYVAMDIKAPLESDRYGHLVGVDLNGLFDDIKRTVEFIIASGVDHEFRTTVVPGLHTKADVEDISRSIRGAKRYFLQKFQPNTRFEDLNKEAAQSDDEMEALAGVARRNLENVEWRGR